MMKRVVCDETFPPPALQLFLGHEAGISSPRQQPSTYSSTRGLLKRYRNRRAKCFATTMVRLLLLPSSFNTPTHTTASMMKDYLDVNFYSIFPRRKTMQINSLLPSFWSSSTTLRIWHFIMLERQSLIRCSVLDLSSYIPRSPTAAGSVRCPTYGFLVSWRLCSSSTNSRTYTIAIHLIYLTSTSLIPLCFCVLVLFRATSFCVLVTYECEVRVWTMLINYTHLLIWYMQSV